MLGECEFPFSQKKLLSKLGHPFYPDLSWMGQGHIIISSLRTRATYLSSELFKLQVRFK